MLAKGQLRPGGYPRVIGGGALFLAKLAAMAAVPGARGRTGEAAPPAPWPLPASPAPATLATTSGRIALLLSSGTPRKRFPPSAPPSGRRTRPSVSTGGPYVDRFDEYTTSAAETPTNDSRDL